MFDLAGNDMPSPLRSALRNALERQVVRFGRAGRPDDLPGPRTDEVGDLPASLLDRLPSLLAIRMGAGGRVTMT
jgi:hypothetical protein